jgi:pilus assembly protein Flp/PilA
MRFVKRIEFCLLTDFLTRVTVVTVIDLMTLRFTQLSLISFGEAIMIYSPAEKGQGLVEYALILALVAIVVIVVLSVLGDQVNTTLGAVGNTLNDANANIP